MRIWKTHPVLFMLLLVTSALFIVSTFGHPDPTHARSADDGAVTMTFATAAPEDSGAAMDLGGLALGVAVLGGLAVLVLALRRRRRAGGFTLTCMSVRLN
ncbi:MAG TPA: hypothetical protein VF062_05815 [Candidatus Limnocylindrales bacterium]